MPYVALFMMSINLHNQRLGLSLSRGDSPLLQVAVQTELTRLLTSGGLSDALQSGSTLYTVKTAGIQLSNEGGPTREQVARTVYGGIGK